MLIYLLTCIPVVSRLLPLLHSILYAIPFIVYIVSRRIYIHCANINNIILRQPLRQTRTDIDVASGQLLTNKLLHDITKTAMVTFYVCVF